MAGFWEISAKQNILSGLLLSVTVSKACIAGLMAVNARVVRIRLFSKATSGLKNYPGKGD